MDLSLDRLQNECILNSDLRRMLECVCVYTHTHTHTHTYILPHYMVKQQA